MGRTGPWWLWTWSSRQRSTTTACSGTIRTIPVLVRCLTSSPRSTSTAQLLHELSASQCGTRLSRSRTKMSTTAEFSCAGSPSSCPGELHLMPAKNTWRSIASWWCGRSPPTRSTHHLQLSWTMASSSGSTASRWWILNPKTENNNFSKFNVKNFVSTPRQNLCDWPH